MTPFTLNRNRWKESTMDKWFTAGPLTSKIHLSGQLNHRSWRTFSWNWPPSWQHLHVSSSTGTLDPWCKYWSNEETMKIGEIWTPENYCHILTFELEAKFLILYSAVFPYTLHEPPPRDKTNKMTMRPVKTQISLGIHPVWSEPSLFTWRKLGSLATHGAHSQYSDQSGWMPRLIWVFAGRTNHLLVLS